MEDTIVIIHHIHSIHVRTCNRFYYLMITLLTQTKSLFTHKLTLVCGLLTSLSVKVGYLKNNYLYVTVFKCFLMTEVNDSNHQLIIYQQWFHLQRSMTHISIICTVVTFLHYIKKYYITLNYVLKYYIYNTELNIYRERIIFTYLNLQLQQGCFENDYKNLYILRGVLLATLN